MTSQHDPEEDGDDRGATAFIAGPDFNFEEIRLPRPQMEAAALLRESGRVPTLDYRLSELTFPGTSTPDQDDVVDFRGPPKYFVAAKSDRLFAFGLDEISYELPVASVPEPALRFMAKTDEIMVLFLERKDQPDLQLTAGMSVSLAGNEVERIYTRPATVTVCLDREIRKELPRGSYAMETLISLLGVAAGFVLQFVDAAGKLTSFKPGQKVQIFDGMKFFSHAAGGGAS